MIYEHKGWFGGALLQIFFLSLAILLIALIMILPLSFEYKGIFTLFALVGLALFLDGAFYNIISVEVENNRVYFNFFLRGEKRVIVRDIKVEKGKDEDSAVVRIHFMEYGNKVERESRMNAFEFKHTPNLFHELEGATGHRITNRELLGLGPEKHLEPEAVKHEETQELESKEHGQKSHHKKRKRRKEA